MSARAWNRRRAAKRARLAAQHWRRFALPAQSWVIFDEAWQMSEADLNRRLSAGRQRRWLALDRLFGEGVELEGAWPATVESLTVQGVVEVMEKLLEHRQSLCIEFDLDDVAPEALALLCGDSSATIGDNEGETPPP